MSSKRANKSNKRIQQKPPAMVSFEEAEQLQQRGDLKKGEEAINLYKSAVEKYTLSIQQGLTQDQIPDAHTFIGECYHKWAETIIETCEKQSIELLTLQKEQEAKSLAIQLFQKATEAYISAGEREDSLLGYGNALAAWAENVDNPIKADQLFAQALNTYKRIQGMQDDVDTLSNYADVCMQRGQLLCENGKLDEGMRSYYEGAEVYMRACSQCDSSKGDDLPGLLSNWGNALIDMADNIQDLDQAVKVYDEAVQRLLACIQFARGDVDPFISLGNALSSKAEKLNDLRLYKEAIQKGYEGALRINNNTMEAMVGIAETLFKMAKLSTDEQAKKLYTQQSLERFQIATVQLNKIEGFQERCDVKYNFACVLVLNQQLQEAEVIMKQLLHDQGVSIEEVLSDEDLQPLHQSLDISSSSKA